MARHFAQLKLALLASAFKGARAQAVGLVVAVLVSVPVAVGVALALTIGAGRPVGPSLLVLVFALLTAGWTLGPLLLFGTDETLDPARLQLLPLSDRQLLTGLTVAGAVGVGPLATAIVLLAGFAYVTSPVGAVIAAVAIAGQLLVCLWAGRALSTALSSALRSRKGRDLASLSPLLAGLGVAGLGQIPNLVINVLDQRPRAAARELVAALDGVAGAVAWTPLGWGAGAIVAAGQGRLAAALASLAALAALAAALAWAWQAALHRNLTTPDSAAGAAGRDEPLLPRPLGWPRPGRLWATLGKELHYVTRVPQLRMGLALLGLLSVGLIAATALVDQLGTQWVVFAPAALGLMSALQAVNLFGHDGGAVWLLVSAGGPHHRDIAGKSLGHLAATVAVLTPVVLVLAALTGGWAQVVPALVALVTLQLTAHGVGALASVLQPAPMPGSTSNVWASSSGAGCSTALLQVGAMLAQAVLLAPLVAGTGATALLAPAWLPLALVLATVYAAGVWLAGVQLAALRLEARAPEFVVALSAVLDR